MRLSRFHQRLTAWIAVLAVLLGALAPTLTHASAAARGEQGWVEVCTAAGVVWLAPDRTTDDGDGQGSHATQGAHCPYCCTHAGSFGLPPLAATAFALADGADFLPPLYYHAPRPLFSWAASQPRAPPYSA